MLVLIKAKIECVADQIPTPTLGAKSRIMTDLLSSRKFQDSRLTLRKDGKW